MNKAINYFKKSTTFTSVLSITNSGSHIKMQKNAGTNIITI